MKTNFALAAILFLPSLLLAAETRIEVIKPTTPAEDSKANSDAVPDVYATEGKFDRIIVLRFKHKADLLAGLEKMVREKKIQNGVILAGTGSVRSYHYHTVSNREFPSKNLFIQNEEAAADIVSMNGYIIDGKLHPHITFAAENKAFGGHLEPGTAVFTFAAVTIGVLDKKANLTRLDDKTYR
jgi:predicted DNA-binding protein with PD1-like motif